MPGTQCGGYSKGESSRSSSPSEAHCLIERTGFVSSHKSEYLGTNSSTKAELTML